MLGRFVCVAVAAGFAGRVDAADPVSTYATIYSLGSYFDSGLLAGPNGALYGTLSLSESDQVQVFRLNPPSKDGGGWTLSDLAPLRTGSDTLTPGNLVADSKGVLYGTTKLGGYKGKGSVFQVIPPDLGHSGWRYGIIYSFTGGADGQYPPDGVTEFDGVIYGVTSSSGPSGNGVMGGGTVFSLMPPLSGQKAWRFSVLHGFALSPTDPIGAPDGGVLARQVGGITTLFGTTTAGVQGANRGTIFQMSAPTPPSTTWTYTSIFDFGVSGKRASFPLYGLAADRGLNLYGVAGQDADPFGTVYRLSPPALGQTAWVYSDLYDLSGGEAGQSPGGPVTLGPDGRLYGTTLRGAVKCAQEFNGCGAVYRLTPRDYGGHLTPWNEATLSRNSPAFNTPINNHVVVNYDYTSQLTSIYYGTGYTDYGTVSRIQVASPPPSTLPR